MYLAQFSSAPLQPQWLRSETLMCTRCWIASCGVHTCKLAASSLCIQLNPAVHLCDPSGTVLRRSGAHAAGLQGPWWPLGAAGAAQI